MICVGGICDTCNNIRENKDGWIPVCSAFPEGIPKDYLNEKIKKEERTECNNGIGYEPNQEMLKLLG